MAREADSYFKSGLHQLRCAPRLVIPFLVSEALFFGLAWTGFFIFVLISLPLLSKAIPIIEKNQDMISEIIANQRFDTDPRIQELGKEFSNLVPDMLIFLIIFFASLLIIVIIAFLSYAWAHAGTVGYTWQGVTGSLDFKNFRYYAGRNVFKVAGVWIFTILISILLFIVPFSSFIILPSPANIIVFILLMLIFFIIWIIAMLLLFFVEECVVIDDRGVLEAIKQSRDISSHNIGSILVFAFILICIVVFYVIISGVLELIASMLNSDLSRFFDLILLIFIGPWISLAKLNFFLDVTGRNVSIMEKEVDFIKVTRKFVAESPMILVDFARKNSGYILMALSFLGIGAGLGYYIGRSLSFLSDEFISIFEQGMNFIGPYSSLPFIDILYYFSNNSMVALNQGLSGLFFIIPSALGMVGNGILVGLFYGVFSAGIASSFIALHGIFEMLGFIISTAAGMKLGAGFLKGSADENEILDETLKVICASLLLIGIAAFLEAFITPIIISAVI